MCIDKDHDMALLSSNFSGAQERHFDGFECVSQFEVGACDLGIGHFDHRAWKLKDSTILAHPATFGVVGLGDGLAAECHVKSLVSRP